MLAEWMDMEDYSQQHMWRESPLYKEMNGAMLKAARRGIAYSNPLHRLMIALVMMSWMMMSLMGLWPRISLSVSVLEKIQFM